MLLFRKEVLLCFFHNFAVLVISFFSYDGGNLSPIEGTVVKDWVVRINFRLTILSVVLNYPCFFSISYVFGKTLMHELHLVHSLTERYLYGVHTITDTSSILRDVSSTDRMLFNIRTFYNRTLNKG